LHWSPTGTNAKWQDGDFNGDGKVDSLDVAILRLNWNPVGP